MKIGIVCYPTFGGSGVVATELGIELSKRGHEVHFITYKQPVRLGLLESNVHFHEVNVPEYPLFHYQPYELALSSKLVDIAKKERIEILHVHYAIPHAYAAFMAQRILVESNIFLPIVTTLHGTDITLVGNHPDYKPAVTFSIEKSDAVTSVSKSLKQDTLKLFAVEKEVTVVPNFIDLERYGAMSNKICKRRVLARDDERIISHVSNLRKVKRIQDVITIFRNVQEQIKSKLIIIGEGPEKRKAEKLCRDLNIENKVAFLGNSMEVDEILAHSDLFLLPSEMESFGLSALEAMASSCPVVTTDTGGLPEVNKHGKSGFLSQVGDTDEMSQHALFILEDDDRLQGFKKKARQRAKKFDIHQIVPQYEDIYSEVMKKCSKKTRIDI